MLTITQDNLTEIPLSSPYFPSEWKELSDCPEKLYALGDISLLKGKKLAVVGSRRTPTNALKLGAEISKALSEELVLVTGTADGGDSAALADALDATGVAVRGGLHCAPAMHSYLGTMKSGAVRFAPGPYNTEQEIDDTAALVARLMRQ